jgi:L-ascorbate metabolism protein UlaG (beta-lactamase superfamily)
MLSRRLVLRGVAATSFLPVAAIYAGPWQAFAQQGGTPVQPDTVKTGSGDLVIQPVNHASVVLTFGSDVFYIDPVGGGERYKSFNKPTAILITHAHGDHFDVPTLTAIAGSAKMIIGPQLVLDGLPAELKAKAKLMANGDSGTVNDIPVMAVAAYNTTPDRLKFHPKGVGNGYVLSFGDKKVYVAGDTEDTAEMRALVAIDVTFLPMNLPYTMSGEQVASAVKTFKPKIVYPYHYAKDGPEPAKFAAALKGFPDVEVRQRDWYAYG